MSKSRYVATNTTGYALGGVILVVFLAAVIGIFGQTGQLLALYMTFSLAPVCVRLFIRSSVWLLNRICRHRREALSATCEDDAAACDIDPTTERLKSTLDTMRREEVSCAARRARRRCSSDDLIRARSLRVQAEIALLRHEAMPKPWGEACGKGLSRT